MTSARHRHEPFPRVGARLLIALLGLMMPALAGAFDLQSDAPIRVNADHARIDEGAGEATYTGNVIVRQNETTLTAEKVVLHRQDGVLKQIEATGEPAHYTQPARNDRPKTDAEAHVIIYSAGDNRILLRQQAVIRQAGNVFRGERIDYDTAKRVVTATGSDTNPDGRVEMIIQPGNQSGDNR
ncbi:lipopolysaccharide transport periplasmic protein LptA [Tamilnaduibacter salinus]|uniref:lipopolysaccharide transport periplasmic protein LptA n=1 Tax=Tamilnaduibacter salinus TaxID=1484056 RepID=UPI001D17BF4C|nr:lipopolysaccharide transport periplasmic protein LptA [Tamilnaduibacter salinus]